MPSESDPDDLYKLCLIASGWNNRVSSFATAGAEAAFQDIRDWLNDYRNPREAAARYTNQEDNSAPLHVLVASDCPPLDVVKQIIELAPETVCQLTSDLRSPLQMARQDGGRNEDVINYLSVSVLYDLCVLALTRLSKSEEEREAAFRIIRDWLAINTNTCEAAAKYTNARDNNSPLHVLVAARPPLDLVRKIIKYAPETVGKSTIDSRLPLQISMEIDDNRDVTDYLLKCEELYNLCVRAQKALDGLFIERQAIFQDIRDWLTNKENPCKAASHYRNQLDNSAPLHVLVAARSPFDLVRQIISYAPETVSQPTNDGRLPLRIAEDVDDNPDLVYYLKKCEELYNLCVRAQKARDSVFIERQTIFQDIRDWSNNNENPRNAAARYRNHVDNSSPLHVLVAARPPLDLVRQIIVLAPQVVFQLTNDGRSPYQIARVSKASSDVVYCLLISELYSFCVMARDQRNDNEEERVAAFKNIRDWLVKNNELTCKTATSYTNPQDNSSPLHVLVAASPPLDVIKQIIEITPQTVAQLTYDGRSPLQIAYDSEASLDVIYYLSISELYSLCIIAKDRTNAFEEERKAAFKNIRNWLVKSNQLTCKHAATYKHPQDSSSPLHVLVAARPPLDLVKNFVELIPETVSQPTNEGWLPLQIAENSGDSQDVIDYLRKCEKLYNLCVRAQKARDSPFHERQAIFQDIRCWLANNENPRRAAARYTTYQDNRSPLHVLVAARPPLDVIKQIIEITPQTVVQLTYDGRSPLQIAYDSKATQVVIDCLKASELYALCVIARDRLNDCEEEGKRYFRISGTG